MIDGQGQVPNGGLCDSSDDCGGDDNIGCWEGGPEIDDNMCTIECMDDSDCEDLRAGSYCQGLMTWFGEIFICMSPCLNDDACDASEQCTAGRCEPRPLCYGDGDCTDESERCDFWTGYCHEVMDEVACGDDGSNDGVPSLGTVLQSGQTLQDRHICEGDLDWYQVVLAADHQEVTLEITFDDDAADLDIYAFDAQGNFIGASYGYSSPETIELGFLPQGPVYMIVNFWDGEPIVTYDVSATVSDGPACEQADCDGTEPLRMTCNANGACESFAGNGEVPLGGMCDSNDDCADADVCYTLEGGVGRLNRCTITCWWDEDCELAGIENASCVYVEAYDVDLCLGSAPLE